MKASHYLSILNGWAIGSLITETARGNLYECISFAVIIMLSLAAWIKIRKEEMEEKN